MTPNSIVAGAFKPIALVFALGLVSGIVANFFFPFELARVDWVCLLGVISFAIGF